jgi:hypothetical protein
MAQNERKSKQEQKEKKAESTKFDWKDYLAITIAALQTSLLPFVLLIIVILVTAIVIGFLFH